MPLDFGSVPDWVEAIGTSGALVYIAVQFQRERIKDRLARAETESLRLDREAEQARKILVLTEYFKSNPQGIGIEITVKNESTERIRHLELRLLDLRDNSDGIDRETAFVDAANGFYRYPELEPGDKTQLWARTLHQEEIPGPKPARPKLNASDWEKLKSDVRAYQEARRRLEAEEREVAVKVRKLLAHRYRAVVAFTDFAGRRWVQDEHGVPGRLLGEDLKPFAPPPNVLSS